MVMSSLEGSSMDKGDVFYGVTRERGYRSGSYSAARASPSARERAEMLKAEASAGACS
jgi:hypothetical protein